MKKQPQLSSLSIFFPAYNDQHTIGELVKLAIQTARQVTSNFEVIVVNDGSHDRTGLVLARLQKKYRQLRVHTHPQNRGYGAALISGFTQAKKNWVFYTDGDGQYDPRELTKLVALAGSQTDVVNGYKRERHDEFYRSLIGALYNFILHRLYPVSVTDLDCDFRLVRRTIMKKIHLKYNSGIICLEMILKLAKAGARFQETAVSHYERPVGHSQFFRPAKLWRTLQDHWHFFREWYHLDASSSSRHKHAVRKQHQRKKS